MVNQFAQPGDELVNATSTHNNVRVHASVREDGSVAVMILNMHVSEMADVDVNIAGLDVESDGLLYTLTGGTTMSAATPISGLGNLFNASVAPRSIMTFIIPAAPEPVLFGDYNGDNIVNAADYTVWRNNLGVATDDNILNRGDGNAGIDENDYVVWKQNYGVVYMPGSGGLSSAVPEPSTIVMVLMGGLPFLRRRGRR